ncbi:hypothetical protein AJ79_08594 [Helicocarpus griseus UAMH5409]|uniref:Pre-rRNA-processing protein TSR2 n=1 Tax=Helicocarpus griseus UAMH5409 TaxID=1447875 RepID=A0A2B7WRY4_9EURO|nr:hypothetical protein AJ79_08594 [Helicocarpus griseus UAMH5409]
MATNTPQDPTSKDPSAQFDLAITLLLNTWPTLSLAVQNSWGGPTSADKRDWLCGAISDLFNDRPETDAEDVEEVLIQVMNDEFDVVVDDESAGEVAGKILTIRQEIAGGEFGGVQRLWEEWKAKGGKNAGVEGFRKVEVGDDEGEVGEDEDFDWADDVEMDDVPATSNVSNEPAQEARRGIDGQWERGKYLPEPEVDEDGFTKVVSKKRR